MEVQYSTSGASERQISARVVEETRARLSKELPHSGEENIPPHTFQRLPPDPSSTLFPARGLLGIHSHPSTLLPSLTPPSNQKQPTTGSAVVTGSGVGWGWVVSGDIHRLTSQKAIPLIHCGPEQEPDPRGLALLVCEIAPLRGPF